MRATLGCVVHVRRLRGAVWECSANEHGRRGRTLWGWALKIELPRNGYEAKGDGKGSWNEFEMLGVIGEGRGLGEIMAVETVGDGADE